jgi:hypothetical protein
MNPPKNFRQLQERHCCALCKHFIVIDQDGWGCERDPNMNEAINLGADKYRPLWHVCDYFKKAKGEQ